MGEWSRTVAQLPRVAETRLGVAELNDRLAEAREPIVLRGIAAAWPLVRASRESADAARAYLVSRALDRKFPVNIGEPGRGERLFYNSEMGMNFRMANGPLPAILNGIAVNENKPDAPAIYLASIDMRQYFSGLAEENSLPLGERKLIESIWIGSRTRIAAHNDVPNNLAVCTAGKRRFTLFPPLEYRNLYPGPIENTPAGRPVSMVDFDAPDFDAFPGFQAALDAASVAELEPGDAVFVPSMWWHHVEALEPFNILVNYWWRDVPQYLGEPEHALNHAILAVRDLADADKAVWRDLFDHYVFTNGADVTSHIPESARGILAPLDAEGAGRIRAFLMRSLSQ